ncbi:MAG: hypothetical protein WC373_11820 [Smithella sp.]|jgi:hypothetical protein
MKELDYCSLGVAKRLVAAGITVETEAYWIKDYDGTYSLTRDWIVARSSGDYIPTPSFAELWRETPDLVFIEKYDGYSAAHFGLDAAFRSKNPADALAELKIWVEGNKK